MVLLVLSGRSNTKALPFSVCSRLPRNNAKAGLWRLKSKSSPFSTHVWKTETKGDHCLGRLVPTLWTCDLAQMSEKLTGRRKTMHLKCFSEKRPKFEDKRGISNSPPDSSQFHLPQTTHLNTPGLPVNRVCLNQPRSVSARHAFPQLG